MLEQTLENSISCWRQQGLLGTEKNRELKKAVNKKNAVKIQRWQAQARSKEKQVSSKRNAQREACQEKETSTESGWNDIGFKRQQWHQKKLVRREECVKSLASKNVRSKPHQTDVESKKCQGQRLPRDHAVDGRASKVVRRGSYRLFLVFMGSSSRNFRHPACRGPTCTFHIPVNHFWDPLKVSKHVQFLLLYHLSYWLSPYFLHHRTVSSYTANLATALIVQQSASTTVASLEAILANNWKICTQDNSSLAKSISQSSHGGFRWVMGAPPHHPSQ